VRLSSPRRGVKLYEIVLEVLVDLEDGGLVATTVAIVGCAEYGDGVSVVAPRETLHCQLMRARDEHQPIVVVELLGDVLPKRVPRATRRNAPSGSVVRIRPEQIAHGTLVWHLLSRQLTNLIEQIDGRREAAMHAEDLRLDERGQRHVVEEIGEYFPNVGVAILAQALVVEAVDLRDLPRLVVAAQQVDALAVAHLERDEQRDSLHRVVATIHIIAHEEVVRVGARAADAENLHKIVELGVDVAADDHGRAHRLHIGLLVEDLAGLLTERLDLLLCERLAVH